MATFAAVAEAGSLSAAAKQLSMPLTTLSRHLAWLEDHVGTSLITRTTRHMALTDAGRRYLSVCRRVIEDLDGIESQLKGKGDDLAGSFILTAPIVFGRLHVLPIVADFLAANPGVDCRMVLSDRNVDLARDNIDLAVGIGALASSALVAAKVGELRLITCAAPSYLKRRAVPDSPAALAAHDCIAFSNFAGRLEWVFRSAAHGQHRVRLAPRLEVNTAEAAIDAAIAGGGVTRVLSYQAEASLRRNRLVAILDEFDDASIPVQVVHRAVRLPKPQVRALVPLLSASLRKRLVSIQEGL